MIDIFARRVDGKLICEPKKTRGMTKGEYLRALSMCNELNQKPETTAEPKKQKTCMQISLPF